MGPFVSYLSQIRGNLTFVLLKALFHCVAPSIDSQFPLKHFPDLAGPPWLCTDKSTFHSLVSVYRKSNMKTHKELPVLSTQVGYRN